MVGAADRSRPRDGEARRKSSVRGKTDDMRIVDGFEGEAPFDLVWPSRVAAPLLLASPHSGRDYPRDFLTMTRLDRVTIRRSEDAFVDDLCLAAAGGRLPVLAARFPRAWLDVNRERLELDPRMFTGAVPADANTRSTRVAGGLGTIPRIVTERDDIYRGPIPIAEAMARIERAYEPYHATLRHSLARLHGEFGRAVLIDCHSMPSSQRIASADGRVDIVLGDRHGKSCHPALTDLAATLLRDAGYRVTLNKPYAGGYTTEAYGRPERGLEALQIEISRALYLNETTITRTTGFAPLARDFTRFIDRLVAGFAAIYGDLRQAAE